MNKLIVNQNKYTVQAELSRLADKADTIYIAVAFFSESELIKKWSERSKKISLIISLRPPTSYYALKDIQTSLNTQIYFLGAEFHSKFWIFYKGQKFFAAVLGSSNFTNGGLVKNTEANLLIEDKDILANLHTHFTEELLEGAANLEPEDLRKYKKTYDEYVKNRSVTEKRVKEFLKRLAKRRRSKRIKPCKEARRYFEFWRLVDNVREILKPYCDKYFPGKPYYFVLDHFWHWVKAVWYKETGRKLHPGERTRRIPQLFKQYYKWQTSEEDDDNPEYMVNQSKRVFQRYLSLRNIDKLTMTQALEVYRGLHSSGMRIKRFDADTLFKKTNNVGRIRKSLKYLLYSGDDMDVRIHNLLNDYDYKINELGKSGVQEINGWMHPDKYPIRNAKADKALEIIGFKF